MKTQIKRAISVLALALPLCGAALANDRDDDGCSDATLHGLYVFNASGFNVVAGVAQPKAVVELIHFNGDGTLTVEAATASINGSVSHSAHGVGSYTI